MCPYRDTWVISQNASAALKYMSGVGAEPSPPRLGPSSEANVMWPEPPRLTVASLRNGVTRLTSASNTISRVWTLGSSPWGTVVMIAPYRTGLLLGRALTLAHFRDRSFRNLYTVGSGDSCSHSEGGFHGRSHSRDQGAHRQGAGPRHEDGLSRRVPRHSRPV